MSVPRKLECDSIKFFFNNSKMVKEKTPELSDEDSCKEETLVSIRVPEEEEITVLDSTKEYTRRIIGVAKTEMGGVFKKLCCKTDNINNDDGSENAIDSPEEFYTYLRMELEDDEIYRLKYLFFSIKIVEQQVGRAFYKFVSTRKFRKRFRHELDKHRSRIHNDDNLQVCLMDHCFAVIWVHLDILKAIQSASAIHKLLYEIAACHIHFKDFGGLLKMHDRLLIKFIKIEFEKYTNKFTLQSLEKYFTIISNRVKDIKEDMERIKRASNIANSVLNRRRTSVGVRVKELNTLRQIYSGIRIQSSTNFFEDCDKVGTSAPQKADVVIKLEKIESGISMKTFSSDVEDFATKTGEVEKADSSNLQKIQGESSTNFSMNSAGTSNIHKVDASSNLHIAQNKSLMDFITNSEDIDKSTKTNTVQKAEASNLQEMQISHSMNSSISSKDTDTSSGTSMVQKADVSKLKKIPSKSSTKN